MTATPRTKSDPKKQVAKFRKLARELECDDDEARFDDRLRKIAKAPRPTKEGAP